MFVLILHFSVLFMLFNLTPLDEPQSHVAVSCALSLIYIFDTTYVKHVELEKVLCTEFAVKQTIQHRNAVSSAYFFVVVLYN